MIITRLRLTNWRNFQHVDVELGRRVFIAGPNASGKSNLLDAIRFLRDIAKSGGGLEKAITDRGGLSKIRCLAARAVSEIELEIHLSNQAGEPPVWEYAIGIKQESRGHRQPFLMHERVRQQGRLLLNRPERADLDDKQRLTQTYLQQVNANATFREVARFLESISYLHVVPQFLRHPEMFAGSNGEDPFGGRLLEKIAGTTERTRKARLRRIEKALRYAVPQLQRLADTKDIKGTPHLEAFHAHWRAKDARQSEEEFSDGTLRMIGLFWALLDGASPLLLEEPELSLHPGIIRRLPGLIWRTQQEQNRQVLISTHSADLLADSGIGLKEVLLLAPSREGTRIESATKITDAKQLLQAGISLADIVIPKTEPHHAQQLSLDV